MQLNRKCAVKIEKCEVKSYYWCSQFLTTLLSNCQTETFGRHCLIGKCAEHWTGINHRICWLIKNGKFINIVATSRQNLITKCTKIGWGFAPRPHWGSSRRSPRPLSRMGRGTPPLHTHSRRCLKRRAFGARSVCGQTFSLF